MKNYSSLRVKMLGLFTLIAIFSIHNVNAQLFLLGGGFNATDTNSDGTVVVGDNGSEHFVWTESGGITLIGGVGPSGFGGQTSVNGAGTVVAGTRVNPGNNLGELSSYNLGTQTWTSHGSLGSSSGNSASSAWGFSADGSTIVGLGWISAGNAHAIKWTSGGGIEDLGSTVAGRSTRANKANNDGSIIGGWQDSSSGFRQGVIWINGVQTLITHPNGDSATEVGAMSRDGVWMGGGQGFGNNFQAWKWSMNTGIIDIGPAPTAGWRGAISGLSEDGSIAVGFYRPFPAPAVFGRGIIHTDATGMLDLTDLAISLGIDVQGAILALPLDISDDGSTIVGLTDSGSGFVLRLPDVPINNTCSTAIPVSCNSIVFGSTTTATDNGGNSSPDVFYSYTGNGQLSTITVSLCGSGTNFDTVLRSFTDCAFNNEITNDDFCGTQSELEFPSYDLETTYILVEGAGTASGDFELEITCEPVLGQEDRIFANLNLFPNPVDDRFVISNNELISEVIIYNFTGQEIMRLSPNATAVDISTSTLARGMYFASVQVANQSRTLKFVK